jgi:hypothetical protein
LWSLVVVEEQDLLDLVLVMVAEEQEDIELVQDYP